MAATAGLWCSKYVYFQMVFVCCVFHLAFGGQLRELTVGELQNLGHSTKMDFIAVFFDRPGCLAFSLICLNFVALLKFVNFY